MTILIRLLNTATNYITITTSYCSQIAPSRETDKSRHWSAGSQVWLLVGWASREKLWSEQDKTALVKLELKNFLIPVHAEVAASAATMQASRLTLTILTLSMALLVLTKVAIANGIKVSYRKSCFIACWSRIIANLTWSNLTRESQKNRQR